MKNIPADRNRENVSRSLFLWWLNDNTFDVCRAMLYCLARVLAKTFSDIFFEPQVITR